MNNSDEHYSDSIDCSGMTLEAGLHSFFHQSGLGFGSADILFLGPGKVSLHINAIIQTLLGFQNSEGCSPIHQFMLIVPLAAEDVEMLRAQLEQLLVTCARFPTTEVSANDRLRIIIPSNLCHDTVLSIIKSAPPLSVVIVANAAFFRTEDVQPYGVSGGTETLTVAEDLWAPQLHALAQRLVDAMKERDVYVILDAGQSLPHRPALSAMLQSIDNVGVLGCEMIDDPNSVLVAKADEWHRWLAEGRLGAVLKSIDSLPSSLDSEKPFLRIQIFHRAGLHGQALEAIETLPHNDNLKPSALVKLARISADAGAALLAMRLLDRAITNLDISEDFELAIAIASDIHAKDLEAQIANRFEKMFPDSTALRHRHVRLLVRDGNYHAAATMLASEPDASEARELYTLLGEALDGNSDPDYTVILQNLTECKPSCAPTARTVLIKDALRRHLIVHALDLAVAIQSQGDASRQDVGLMLDVIEQLLLNRDSSGKLAVETNRLKAAVMEVVRYLSAHPTDGFVRICLTRLLSVNISGSLGLPLIASAALDFIHRPLSIREKIRHSGLSAEELYARRSFLDSAFAWLEAESPVMLSYLVLPLSLLADPPDDLAPAITEVLLMIGSQIKDESDVNSLMNWLSLGVSLVPHTSDPDQDLAMIRLAAARLVVVGRVQQARDMAEQALQISRPNPQRRRVAWFTMADIYHRLGNHLESLLAFACAAAGDPDVDLEQLWHETNGLARLLRDIGLFDLAREVHNKAGDLLDRMGLIEVNQHRHQLLGLQISIAQLLQTPERFPTALPGLLVQVVDNAKEVLVRNDDPTPITIMLSQLLRIAEESGVTTPFDAGTTVEALLERTSGSITSLVRAISSKNPSVEDILCIHNRIERARYAEDVGYDVRNSVLAARRLLASDEAGRNPEVAAFAIELLADRAIATPGWETTAKPPPSIASVSEPSAIAKTISTKKVTVMMMGLDAGARLVLVTATSGRLDLVLREELDVFSAERLRSWAKEFPYRYGIDEETPNLFYVSTERLGVSTMPEGCVLLITDTELQQLPPNLIRINDEFAGQTRAMAAAPSLSWLAAAQCKSAKTTKHMAAWISIEEKRGHTLSMIAERLKETLVKHDIAIDTGAELPQGLAGAKLVVVAAHGGIAPEGRFFQRVSDEGDLKVSSAKLAGTLQNVSVVILFVCSGGRADKHPAASTTIGLAKQLLDRGCTAVIASPWPLDARVTYHWLPVFLDTWKSGSSLMESNFQANLAVAKALGDDPAKCLAMTVFGDPLKTFNP